MTETVDSAGDIACSSGEPPIAAVPYPYIAVDPNGEITAVNDRLVDRVEIDRDTLVGRDLTTILSVPADSVADTLATRAVSTTA